MKKYVLILGGGLMQKPAIEAAKKLNCHITLADGNPNALCKDMVDVFAPVDLKDVEGLIALANKMKKTYGIDGVFTAGTDFSASVAHVAQALNLPGHSVDAALNASDKTRMRKCFAKAGVASPKFFRVTEKVLKEATEKKSLADFGFAPSDFPLVVKPVDNMGGRGCKMVYDFSQMTDALEEAINFSRSRTAILEEYMEGPEFSVDSIVYNGKITITGLADRHIYYPPYFIEMGHTMPTCFSQDDIDKLLETFKLGVKALGLTSGAAKGDIKLTKKGAMIGEIAARLSGGYMSGWTYPYASGIDLTEQLLRIALGMEPSISLEKDYIPCNQFSAERAWLSIPGEVEKIYGLDDAAKINGVKQVFQRSKIGDSVVFPQNNVEKCGNIISQGGTREAAIEASEAAVKKITIQLKKHVKETEEFLSMPLDIPYPPSAYVLPKEIIQKFDELGEKLLIEDGKIIIPEFLKDYSKLKDWNGKTMELGLEQFVEIVGIEKIMESELNNKEFWTNFLRGGLQGALYLLP